MENVRKRWIWIDCLRAMAIILVIQNHLPIEERIFTSQFFACSVPLFVIAGGVTSAITLRDRGTQMSYKEYLVDKVKKVILPYIVATCAYSLYTRGYIDVSGLFVELVCFGAGSKGHMYYLVFYIQLLLIAPFLVRLYGIKEKSISVIILLCSAIGAYFFRVYTYWGSFPLASKYLFGGSSFFLFNLGIFFCFNIHIFEKLLVKVFTIAMSLFAIVFMVDMGWDVEWWSNPANTKLIICSLCILLMIYNVVTLVEALFSRLGRSAFLYNILKPLTILGKYSLFIYLWHVLIIDVLNSYIYSKAMNLVQKLLVFGICAYLPCVIYKSFKVLKNNIKFIS